MAAASSSLICCMRRAFWISIVTFFAICTIAAPSVASTTGQVVTLKIRSPGQVTSSWTQALPAARPTAHCGNGPPQSPTWSHERPRSAVTGRPRYDASAALPRRRRPWRSKTAIASPIASNVASHSCLPARTKACSRAFCTPTATWFAMIPRNRSSWNVKRPGSGEPTGSTPIRSSPANIGTLRAERTSVRAATRSSRPCTSSMRTGARVARTRSLGRGVAAEDALHTRRTASGALMTRRSYSEVSGFSSRAVLESTPSPRIRRTSTRSTSCSGASRCRSSSPISFTSRCSQTSRRFAATTRRCSIARSTVLNSCSTSNGFGTSAKAFSS